MEQTLCDKTCAMLTFSRHVNKNDSEIFSKLREKTEQGGRHLWRSSDKTADRCALPGFNGMV
jgi:hypothetical protein